MLILRTHASILVQADLRQVMVAELDQAVSLLQRVAVDRLLQMTPADHFPEATVCDLQVSEELFRDLQEVIQWRHLQEVIQWRHLQEVI